MTPNPESTSSEITPLINRVYCTFCDCNTCGQFFSDAYTRNYKPNGVKVLRCFPHCCPEHVPHSSCGSSVMMQVAGQYTVDEADTFVAFGRFETCLEPTFPLGHEFHLDDMKSHQPGILPNSIWFQSIVIPASNNALMFQFKENMADPWHYGWTSGASAALRNTQHVFKAYLLRQLPESNILQLIGMAQSPGFTIIPYKPMSHDETELIDPAHGEAEAAPPTEFECHFVACQCEKPMFGDNYIRCNRANGRKQLRCFPHCCPEHILHCSCGGPIMIGVDLSQTAPLQSPSKEIVMYAHGERYQMPELHLHQEIPHEHILSRLHQSGNERGDWVKGIVQPTISTTSTLLFNFNENSRQAGWPYNWRGSATKVDRNRKHIFKAYAFQVSRGGDTLRVVNWISSTPFTMSSFRRCNTTPTSRTNSYIEVKPTEIIDKTPSHPILSRKRSHERVASPPSLSDKHSAG